MRIKPSSPLANDEKKKTHTHAQTHARSNVYTMDMPLCVNGLIFDKMVFLLHSD